MGSSREIHVMRRFTPFLHCLQAYNGTNFQHKTSEVKLKNILFAVFVTFEAATYAYSTTMCAWCVYDDKFALSTIEISLPMLASGVQMVVTMIALTSKNHLISRVLDHLHEIIQKREFV